MDYHRDLFKANGALLCNQNATVFNRRSNIRNRVNKRNILHNQARNITSNEDHHGSEVKEKNSSSGKVEKKHNHENVYEEVDETVPQSESQSSGITDSAHVCRTVTKMEEKKTFLERFIKWKADRMKQKEKEIQEKQKSKPPFIPVGRAKGNTAQQYSFVPKSHVFRPPPGLKDPTLETVTKRKSTETELTIPKSPNRRLSNNAYVQKTRDSNSKSNNATNGLSPRSTFNENAKTPALSSLTMVENLDKNNNVTSEKRGKRADQSQQQGSDNSIVKTASKSGTTTAQNVIVPSKIRTSTQSNRGQEPKKISSTTENATTKKDLVSQPLIKETTKEKSAGAVGKTKIMQQIKQKNVVAKAKNERNNLKPHLATSLKTKNPIKHKSIANANSKLTNAKFSLCLKELCESIDQPRTPKSTDELENVSSILTSTQMKPSSSSYLSAIEFSDLYKTISPLEALNAAESISESYQNDLENNTLLQKETNEKQLNKPRKFNFVREIELDDTALDSPVFIPPSSETITRQSSSRKVIRKKLPVKKDLNIVSRKNETQPKSRTPKTHNRNSRIIKNLQAKLRKKLFQPSSGFALTPLKQGSTYKPETTRKRKNIHILGQAEVCAKLQAPINSPYRKGLLRNNNSITCSVPTSNISGRICNVLDRKSRSTARTAISAQSQSPKCCSSPILKSSIRRFRRDLIKMENALKDNNLLNIGSPGRTPRYLTLQPKRVENTPSPANINHTNSPLCTPKSSLMIPNNLKSILKTPGSAKI